MAARNRLDAGAHDLAIVCRLEQNKSDQRRRKGPDLDGFVGADEPGADVRNQKVKPKYHQHQRDRADQIDISGSNQRNRLDARQSHHGQHRANDNSAQHCKQRQLHGKGHPCLEQIHPRTLDDIKIKSSEHVKCPPPLAAEEWVKPGTAAFFSITCMSVTMAILISTYRMVAAVNASNTWKVNSCIERARAVNSIKPIVSATALFLTIFRNSFVSGGMMMRNAIGINM